MHEPEHALVHHAHDVVVRAAEALLAALEIDELRSGGSYFVRTLCK